MSRPVITPIGLQLARTARAVSRSFDAALAVEGGSLPVWLVLISLKSRPVSNQRELAEAVGIREATLTHHLNAMESHGLLTRRRDPANRRVHMVELTAEGEAAFLRLRDAAIDFDRRIRHGVSEDDLAGFRDILRRLESNAAAVPGNPQAGVPDNPEAGAPHGHTAGAPGNPQAGVPYDPAAGVPDDHTAWAPHGHTTGAPGNHTERGAAGAG